jgi:hypothetical protein
MLTQRLCAMHKSRMRPMRLLRNVPIENRNHLHQKRSGFSSSYGSKRGQEGLLSHIILLNLNGSPGLSEILSQLCCGLLYLPMHCSAPNMPRCAPIMTSTERFSVPGNLSLSMQLCEFDEDSICLLPRSRPNV